MSRPAPRRRTTGYQKTGLSRHITGSMVTILVFTSGGLALFDTYLLLSGLQ
jgi:hypothetical protein